MRFAVYHSPRSGTDELLHCSIHLFADTLLIRWLPAQPQHEMELIFWFMEQSVISVYFTRINSDRRIRALSARSINYRLYKSLFMKQVFEAAESHAIQEYRFAR